MNGSGNSSPGICNQSVSAQPADSSAVLDAVSKALGGSPVGLVLIELLVDFDDPGPADPTSGLSDVLQDRIDRCSGGTDTIVVAGTDRIAIIKPGLTAPAETEGFALRLLNSLGGPLSVGGRPASCRAAIGVAVSRTGDTPVDLIRYAEHALNDAETLGGDMVVCFEDADRELLFGGDDPGIGS